MITRFFSQLHAPLSPPALPTDAPAEEAKELTHAGPARPFHEILPIELCSQVLSVCDDRTFAAMMNVCDGMREAPSSATMRCRIEAFNKKNFCPVLPRSTLIEHYKSFVRGERHLAHLTCNGPRLLDDTSELRYAYFSPNSMFVVAEMTNKSSVRIFDLRSNTPVSRELTAYENAHCIQAVAFSSDSKRVFVSSIHGGDGPKVNAIYSLEDAEPHPVATLPAKHCATRAAFSPDGTKLVIGNRRGGVTLWTFDTGTTTPTPLPGVDGYIYALEFSPDGTRLAVGGSHGNLEREGAACVWNIQGAEPRLQFVLNQDRWVCATRWSPNGTHLLLQSPDPREEEVWDLSGDAAFPDEIAPHEAWVEKRRHSEHDFYAGATNDIVDVRDITFRPAINHDHRNSDAHVVTTNVSPSGRFVVTKDSDRHGQTYLYDGRARPQPPPVHQGWLQSMLTGLISG